MIRKTLSVLLLFTTLLFAQQQPYVLLVSFDAFRWDYLNRGITPNLDTLINKGVRAESFQPAFPSKTFPNHLSIITGMYPENHGIIFNKFTNVNTREVYQLKDRAAVQNPKWYKGEAFWETAEKNGIITASFFWPGSELDNANRRPTYFKYYNQSVSYIARIDTVINWLQLPSAKRPHFITLYFHDTDFFGHKFGPNSPEINQSIKRLDSLAGYINNGLIRIGMKDSVNIIYLSDHGMTEISPERIINIEKILAGQKYKQGGAKTLAMITPREANKEIILSILRKNQNHFKVYERKEMPEYFHFSKNKNIAPILLVADLGWSIVNNAQLKQFINLGNKGNHGYDNFNIDMHGIFVASGPAFKKHYFTGTIRNIDVYPLLCKIFNIPPNPDIDGQLCKIEYILK